MATRTTDYEAILESLREAAIATLGEDAPAIDETTLLDSDVIDSLDLIEILMVLEERFDITLEGPDLNGASSVGDVVDIIVGKLGPAS